MNCICCKTDDKPIESHIISKFIRNRVTGVGTGKDKKFVFQWSRGGKPRQDLQKRKLMCARCDNEAGSAIESLVADLLIPSNPSSIAAWEELPFDYVTVIYIDIYPLNVGVYEYGNQTFQNGIAAFSLLTAWRALHAIAQDAYPNAVSFLDSQLGKSIDEAVSRYFHDVHTSRQVKAPPMKAHLYFMGPRSVRNITRANDEMPFAWALLEKDGVLGIGVAFAYWVVLWPLFDESRNHRAMRELKKMCFIDWHAQIHEYFGGAAFV